LGSWTSSDPSWFSVDVSWVINYEFSFTVKRYGGLKMENGMRAYFGLL